MSKKKKARYKRKGLEKMDGFLDDRVFMVLAFIWFMSVALVHCIGAFRMAGVM